jgi:hypothetical protein
VFALYKQAKRLNVTAILATMQNFRSAENGLRSRGRVEEKQTSWPFPTFGLSCGTPQVFQYSTSVQHFYVLVS